MEKTAAPAGCRPGQSSFPTAGTALLLALALACSSGKLDDGGPREPEPSESAVVAEALFPDGAALTAIYSSTARRSATALAFNPLVPGELWATLRQFPVDAPCTSKVKTGCAALPGEVAVISGADTESPTARVKEDGNSWHFMRRPTSIAFGDNGNFATCPEYRTGNYEDETTIDFIGPTLWSSDPAIFGVKPLPTQNGTHLDMLHSTPFCMGIAHETGNAYWTFNGQIGALDRYDFHEPHPIGGDDHADGELHRYVEGELLRVPEVPSHLALDRAQGLLYIADTGHHRVLRMDITSGTPIGEVEKEYDGMPIHQRMGGAELTVFVAPDVLETPSGIAFHQGIVLVTDNATGTIHVFDRDGTSLRTFTTGLPAAALGGITVGPDERVYVTNLATGQVLRVE
jgi:hypothetical protein